MEIGGQKRPRPAAAFAFPPDLWLHIKGLLGGRAFWIDTYRRTVLPCIPRTTYRFSFVGVSRLGATTYITRYNECALRTGLRRVGKRNRTMRGRRPMHKIYEICHMHQRSTA